MFIHLATFFSQTATAELQWGRRSSTKQVPQASNLQFRSASASQHATASTVAWEEDSPSEDRSILVQRQRDLEPEYVAQKQQLDDPFGEDIPADPPLDDPFGEDVTEKPALDDPFGEDVPAKPASDDPFGENVPNKAATDDPFGEEVPAKPALDDPFGEDVPVKETQPTPTEQTEETPSEVPEEDPFADVDDLMPEFDDEPMQQETQPGTPSEPEPTLEELFEAEIINNPPVPPVIEPTEEPIVEEPTIEEPVVEEPMVEEPVAEEPLSEEPVEEEMTEQPAEDDLPVTQEPQAPAVEEAPTESPVIETPPATERQPLQVPDKEPLDDPFDEPTINQLPTESTDQTLDKEIKQRMDELDSNVLEQEAEPDDTPDPSDSYEIPLDSDSQDDTDPTKLFGDPDSLDLEIGSDVGPRELTEEEKKLQRQILDQERKESEDNCANELAKVKSDRIDDIDLSLRLPGNPGEDYPYGCAVDYGVYQPRQWAQITYNWKASGLCHKPLYFEQVKLERYGHSWGPYVQPLVSGVHFFGTLPILPYKMGLKAPNECVYTLGYYRPGSCAPYLIGGVPFTWRAALYQGGVTTGLIFAIP